MSAAPNRTFADREIVEDLRRQLAERTAERDEGLARETAMAEVLGVINSSPGDLAPVFDAILAKSHALCGAAHGSLQLYDGECLRAVATHAVSDSFADILRRGYRAADQPASRALIEGKCFVHITDCGEVDHPLFRSAAALSGIRTVVFVPLRRDDAFLGLISAARQEVRPFPNEQIALLQSFAAQAVIAMENARLLTETREALEQQTATTEVLQVINSSPGNLKPVFDAMLEKAVALSGASFGTLATYDGQRFAPAAAYGVPPAFAAFRAKRGAFAPPPGSSLERVATGESLVHIADVMTDPGQAATPLVKLGGCRSLVCVALRKDDALVGAITAYRREARPFSDKQIALLQNFAAQAVTAMENARLLGETREALEQQTATAEVLQVINSSPGDLAPIFHTILEKAHSLCGAAKGALWIYDGRVFRAGATRGLSERFAALLRRPDNPPGSPADRLFHGEDFVEVSDIRAVDLPIARAAAEWEGICTILYVPLRKEGTLLGYITAYRQEVRPFTDKQIALLQNFAAQAIIAMENARLITETRAALEQQTAAAEVLQVINASPGDLAPVFDAILEKAHRLCGTDFGGLQLQDGGQFRSVAERGLAGSLAELLRQPLEPAPGSPAARLLHGEQFVHIADMEEWARQVRDAERARAAAEHGFRTGLFVPLRKDSHLLGYITAVRREVRLYSEKEIALLENFAAQAVVAMENARLLGELRQRTDEVVELNRGLEARVAAQVDELGRVGRLKRFLAPQLAEMIIAKGEEGVLESHRREIVVVFCDLRGYTAFTETAEPEEVLDFLREYHGALGPLVSRFEGTLDHFAGDGIMVFFNDPVPCPDPAERAVKMAMAMREAASELIAAWRRRVGPQLGFGVGIAQGYATLGQIGFSERSGYTAIGTVCNLAARLCAAAKDGQILVSSRVAGAVEGIARIEDLGTMELKGLSRPVAASNVMEPV